MAVLPGSRWSARVFTQGGFTLLEIMVVVLIVGIMATFAVLSIGGRALDDRLDTEARRLSELITLAADEAVLQGAELGFLQTGDGYAFLARDPGGVWAPVADSEALRPRSLAEPFYLELSVEGRAVRPVSLDAGDEELKPQVLLLSSGETTAFRLAIKARDHGPYYQLDGDLMGRLKLERKDQAS